MELAIIIGVILTMFVFAAPFMAWAALSRISDLSEKIKALEGRVQQQGLTLKDLYQQMESGASFMPQDIQAEQEQFEAHYSEEPFDDVQTSAIPTSAQTKAMQSQEMQAANEVPDEPMQSAALNISTTASIVTGPLEISEDILQNAEEVQNDVQSSTTQEDLAQKEVQGTSEDILQSAEEAQDDVQPLTMQEDLVQKETQDSSVSSEAQQHAEVQVTQQSEQRVSTKPKAKPKTKQAEMPAFLSKAFQYVLQWFKTGNVPVKIGILVLFAGVAALLNYATTQGWVSFPIKAKLATISAASIAAFAFAWWQREKNRTFSLSVQGGSLGILLLTVFAAYKIYGVMSPELAFGISILLIAFAGVLSVMQNSMAMAIFTILGGFLAPIWLSSGSGNYVALFSYYAILNAGIFCMAWYRPWRFLNLIGFAFTFGIGTFWGALQYTPAKFATTEPFLLLFFAFYLLIPIFYARKYKGELRNVVDASLVFGTPLVAFSLQSVLLSDNRYALAGSAAALGLIYFVLRYIVAGKERYKELAPAYLALGAGFITLAVPLAFSAQQTSCIYALEGAALVWWGIKQNRILSRLSGIALQAFAPVAFLFTLSSFGRSVGDLPIANATFINMLILSGAALFSAWCYKVYTPSSRLIDKLNDSQKWLPTGFLSQIFYLWGLLWWCIAGVREINEFAPSVNNADFAIIFAVVSAWLAMQAHKRWAAKLLEVTASIALVLPFFLIFQQVSLRTYPLAGLGAIAWTAYIGLGAHSLILWRTQKGKELKSNWACFAQFAWWPTLTLAATFTLSRFVGQQNLNNDLGLTLTVLPLLVVTALSIWRWPVIHLPLGKMFDPLKDVLRLVFFIAGVILWVLAMLLPADNSPLPWVPLLNPIEILQIFFVYMLWTWLKNRQEFATTLKSNKLGLLVSVALLFVSVSTLRAVHHWGDVFWDGGILTAPLSMRYLSFVWAAMTVITSYYAVRKNNAFLQKYAFAIFVAAMGAFIASLSLYRYGVSDLVFNFRFFGKLALGLSGLISGWWYLRFKGLHTKTEQGIATAFYVLGLLWVGAAIYGEAQFLNAELYYAIVMLILGCAAWAASKLYQHNIKQAPSVLALTVPAVMMLAVYLMFTHGGVVGLFGITGAAVFAVLTHLSIRNIRAHQGVIDKSAQVAWWSWLAAWLSFELGWLCLDHLQLDSSSAWYQAGLLLPWVLLTGAVIWRWNLVRKPLGESLDAWRPAILTALLTMGSFVWVGALFLPSNTQPLPWIPILNPIDLLQLAFAYMLATQLLSSSHTDEHSFTTHQRALVVSIAGFALMTMMTLRGVHHLGGADWAPRMLSSGLTQTSLSILWSVLGVAAWVMGSRRNQRLIWWAGAILMGIVLAKLIILDRQELGNVMGIVSFIGYGLLCVIVGYVAPVPPKEVIGEEASEEDAAATLE